MCPFGTLGLRLGLPILVGGRAIGSAPACGSGSSSIGGSDGAAAASTGSWTVLLDVRALFVEGKWERKHDRDSRVDFRHAPVTWWCGDATGTGYEQTPEPRSSSSLVIPIEIYTQNLRAKPLVDFVVQQMT
jgi:hypothetical protein